MSEPYLLLQPAKLFPQLGFKSNRPYEEIVRSLTALSKFAEKLSYSHLEQLVGIAGMDNALFLSKYQLELHSKEQLQQRIELERQILEGQG